MRLVFLLIALLLLQACGGAAKRAQIEAELRQAHEEAAAEEEAQNEGPPPADVALAILRDCALDDVGRLLGLLDVFGPLLDPSRPFPDFELTNVDLQALAIHWRLDTTGNGATDMNGTFRFEDADGNIVFPLTEDEVDAIELSGSLASLPPILQELPSGTSLVMQFTQSGAAEVVGILGLNLDAPQVLAGTVNVIATQCTTAFRIRGIDAAALSGAYPDADIPITVSASAGILVGSVILDGTPLATIRVTYDGTPLEFLLDLDTGAVVEIPQPE